MNLQEQIEDFADKWGPTKPPSHQRFLVDLRILLEDYAKAALKHESLPDTEHEHGDPV